MHRLTRREGLAALAAGSLPRRQTPVNFEMPPGACDCHTHIIGDLARFPLWSGRSYTPEAALPAGLAALHRALHIERVVIVTPSIYSTDNAATLYGIKARGASARGVAVIDAKTSDADLAAMDKAGVRGIRLNLETGVQTSPVTARQRFQDAVRRLRDRSWHIQIYARLPVVAQIEDLVLDSPVPVVFDHFGGAQAALGVGQPGFANLVALVRSGRAYVKVSGAYRASTRGPDYADVAPLAKALISAHAGRVVWGTDWPHPDTAAVPGRQPYDVRPPLPIDDGRLLNQLAVWAPDPAVRKQILADNPARLYGF
jgi:predicted TIM-barrel fold metal-dependent hydrolase